MPDVGRADETDTALAPTSAYASTIMAEETDLALRPGDVSVSSETLLAWTFKQDEHEFYGVQLGTAETIIWDKLTNQWCQWKSPTYNYWRVSDVVDWEGLNLGSDSESGKVWKIDPEGRLDYETTPITSKVVGYLTYRMRNHVPCYMAQLSLATGEPPTGFTDGSVGITLRTSVDNGQSFTSHGQVVGGALLEKIVVRWYGLGLMKAPGMLFELTDTGYTRRIDGLNIEVKDELNG